MSIVLIESDWNLKLSKIFRFKTHIGINRIRLEFKAFFTTREPVTDGCINRIRLEFKGHPLNRIQRMLPVLIESDWNLKLAEINDKLKKAFVLIESDWNLKSSATLQRLRPPNVLIESDWNLKTI